MHQKQPLNYPSQFAILLVLIGVGMVLGTVLLFVLGSAWLHMPLERMADMLNKPEYANASRVLNTGASLLAFFMPVMVLARIVNRRPFQYIGFRATGSWKQLGFVLLITLLALLISGALGTLTEQLTMPAAFLSKAKAMEASYNKTMMAMATMKGVGDYLLSLLALAFAPALFEEMLFRGGFQQIFVGWTKSLFAGVLITSILFSAIHFSYFGFLSRLALGLILGFIYQYGKNIWLNILLHFLNNALVVTQLYIAGRQGQSIENAMDDHTPLWIGLIAVLVIIPVFRAFHKESKTVLAGTARYSFTATTTDDSLEKNIHHT